LRAPGSKADLALAARDRVIVFDANASRRQLIEPLLAELRRQSDLAQPTAIVSVGGRVKMPGDYPLEPGMRVSDFVRAGGRLEDAAFPGTRRVGALSHRRQGAHHQSCSRSILRRCCVAMQRPTCCCSRSTP
jgi:hypothetical protein